ncbi:SRPBCC family protein [Cronbergia sp. UHCC 0137]|uniref:SRPBCC family protein n=1 Tax=Cronbergia sp. UHCC 0137 TaxID=3110239 RepID=UPI002B216B20|nr:SRPBCC family protein [Cronbergia sp. UHCC 0137]MEA5620499.1 SRPBCC family protein [Cronbergia sp. UHCC 0137]
MTTEINTIRSDFPASSEDNNQNGNLDTAQVEIQIEKLAERQRQISATIKIPHPPETIWKILTNYEALVDFIPNLAKSTLLEHPNGGIRLEQVGTQRLLNINFCARVVLDLEELFPKLINFRMVEGDFKGFSGSWCLEPYSQGTILCYTIQVWPKLTMPVSIIENRLTKDLQLNLIAICQRAGEFAL